MIRRGEIRWARLPGPDERRRPVLIVSSDAFNASRIGTVLAVVLDARDALAAAPGNVILPAAETGLGRDAVALVSQVVTLDRAWLGAAAGLLRGARLRDVDRGLALAQGLRLP